MNAVLRARHPLVLLGVLTLVAVLVPAVVIPPAAEAAPTDYVEVSDGTLIALNVRVPEECTDEEPCPTIFEMAGYENGSADGRTPSGDLADATGLPLPLQGGSRASHSVFFYDKPYVTIQASLRGTGCSTGEFDLFSWRSALDGREVIDNWIVQQPWSNGDVAIFGHSYSGITGAMIAATRPRHLTAMSVSGLIDDLYRGIVYPGGVTNYGFPLLWTGAVRPLYDYGGGVGGGLFPEPDPQCAANQAGKSRTVTQEPLVHGLDDTDNEWYRSRSLITNIDRIGVPVHITGAYQDEQTGPRGPTHLFEHLREDIPRRLVLTNGDHGTQTDEKVRRDRLVWLDYWMLDRKRAPDYDTKLKHVFGTLEHPKPSTRVLLGYQQDGSFEGRIDSATYPHEDTNFTPLYLSDGGAMTASADGVESADMRWFNGSRRQSYSYQAGQDQGGSFSSPTGPDELEFSYRFDRDTVISGPITANLRVSSSAPETELFVQLIDRAPSGEMLYLQRGMLRTSHRQIMPELSDRTDDGYIYRPYRPHDARDYVVPGTPVDELIEIFPVGHVFREGHELVVKIHAPPADDNDYMYVMKTPATVNTLHLNAEQPSFVTLPVVPMDAVDRLAPEGPEPCSYEEMRCV